MLGLTLRQLLVLVGVAVALVAVWFVVRALLRVTKVVLRLGCLGIVLILAIVFAVMHGLGG